MIIILMALFIVALLVLIIASNILYERINKDSCCDAKYYCIANKVYRL